MELWELLNNKSKSLQLQIEQSILERASGLTLRVTEIEREIYIWIVEIGNSLLKKV